MGHNKILTMFFENPSKEFQIRGIARMLKIPKTTVSYKINAFVKKGIVIRQKGGIFPTFRANNESELYRFEKKQEYLKRIMDSGFLDYIEKETNSKCIILYGSFAKGENDSKSDLDLFVQARDTKIDVSSFEKKLGHPINILFENDINKLSSELFNNILNGIKLRGYVKVK